MCSKNISRRCWTSWTMSASIPSPSLMLSLCRLSVSEKPAVLRRTDITNICCLHLSFSLRHHVHLTTVFRGRSICRAIVWCQTWYWMPSILSVVILPLPWQAGYVVQYSDDLLLFRDALRFCLGSVDVKPHSASFSMYAAYQRLYVIAGFRKSGDVVGKM